MKIKTSELTGAQIDWAVMLATANGVPEPGPNYWLEKWLDPSRRDACERPSTNWAQGGAIIDREEISSVREYYGSDLWTAYMPSHVRDDSAAFGYGPTALVAAMRCFVASKLGDEVEIPEELGERK